MDTGTAKGCLCVKVEEMAKMIGVSRASGYELARSKGFPTVTIGRRILIPVAGLERWLEEQSGETLRQQSKA